MKAESEFLNNLAASLRPVNRVASWLASVGFDVRLLPIAVRPDAGQRMEYGDRGDIEIRMTVEVKKRDLDFTCREDYPFPTVIVDEVYKIKRNRMRLYAYVILNRSEKYACVVPASTRQHWSISQRHDSKEKARREFFECPTEHCKFVRLEGG